MVALLGRTRETNRLTDAVKKLRNGRGGVILVEGEPGIGKTALVEVAVVAAREQGIAVHRAAAEEALGRFPLYLFAGAFAGPSGDVHQPDQVAVEEIVEAVTRRTATGPLLIAVDDLQWADPGSMQVWARLARLDAPLLLIGTTTAARERRTGGEVLELGPLADADALALFAASLPAPPGTGLTALVSEAGGNPFYITELAAALLREDLLAEKQGRLELRDDGAAPPASLVAAIDNRLRTLTTETHGLLRMAALLGHAFDVQELATVLGRSAAGMVDSLDEAHAAEVLTETGDGRITFRHGLIRRVLVEELSASLRAALHRQFAQALAEYGAPFEVVAAHLLAAPGPLAPWVSAWLMRLPDRVLRIAAEPAASLLTGALESLTLPPDRYESLAETLLPILRSLGHESQADDVAAQLLARSTDPERRASAWLARYSAANRRQTAADALAIADAAVADPLLTPGGRGLMRSRRAIVLLKQGSPETAAVAAQALEEAAGDPVPTAYARHVLNHVQQDPEASLAHLDAGLATLAEAGAVGDVPELHALLLGNRLAALNNLGRSGDFREAARELPAVVRRIGRARAASLLLAAAMGDYDFGEWTDALAWLDIMPTELPDVMRMGRHAVAALIYTHQERWSDASRELSAGATIPIVPGDVRIWSGYLVAADAMRAESDGDVAEAAALLSTWIGESVGIDTRERYMWMPALTRLALAAGDRSLADAAVSAAAADAAASDALAMQKAAARLTRAQRDDDSSALLSVSRTYGDHGWPLMRAFALEEAAVRLAAAGTLDEARTAFTDAVRGYDAIGATWDVRRADARLRAHGIRRGSRTFRSSRPSQGWDALTAAELRVAELVRAGRSNPEVAAELFLSPRTIQTHVTRILRKLGYTSRTDLIRLSR